jgi:hypothetical protein
VLTPDAPAPPVGRRPQNGLPPTMTTHTHKFYGSTVNVTAGDVRLANYTETKTPASGEAYLYLNSNVLTLRKNTGDVSLESGGGGVTDPLRLSDGSAAAPTYSFTSGTSTGMFRNASSEIALAAGGVEGMSISSSIIKHNLPQILYSPGTTNRSITKYHKSSTLASSGSPAFTNVATVSIAAGEACMMITDGVSRTGTATTSLEVINTVRTLTNVGGTITETKHIDEVMSDAWQFLRTAGAPDTYTLQLMQDATNTKYYTIRVRILQINNSNVTMTFT